MKSRFTLFILLSFFSFSPNRFWAQCGTDLCSTPPPQGEFGALCAEDACILCDPCLLDGFQGQTLAQFNSCDVPGPFCGSVENNQWWAFLAPPSGEVTFEIEVFNCIGVMGGGSGIQAEVYESYNCDDFTSVSNCWSPGISSEVGIITAFDLEPYSIYYLMIDGWANDICDFNISVAASDCMQPPSNLTGEISGPTQVCVGQIAEYSFSHPLLTSNNGALFPLETALNPLAPFGEILSSTDSTVTIQWVQVGAQVLSANIENECFGLFQFLPLPVEIGFVPPSFEEGDLCIGECVTIAGQTFCSPGFFQVVLSSFNGCDSIVNVILNPLVGSVENITFQMPCNGMLETQGTVITTLGTHIFTYQNSVGCDSSIIVDVLAGPVEPYAGEDVTVACVGPFIYELEGESLNPTSNVSYSWSTADGNIVMGAETPNPTIDALGTYCLTVTDLGSGCQATDCMEVDAGPVPQIIFLSQPIPCEGSAVQLGVELDPPPIGATYEWTTTDGNIVSGANTQFPDVDAAGEYCLTVTYDGGCEATDCIELASEFTVSIDGPTTICPGNATQHFVQIQGTDNAFTLYLQVNGGTPNIVNFASGGNSYNWINSFTPPAALAVWAEDVDGCISNTAEWQVDSDTPLLEFDVSQSLCNSAQINVSYSGNGTDYQWNTGDNTPSITVNETGWYSVTASDDGSCEVTDSIFVEIDLTGNCAYINGKVEEDFIVNCLPDVGDLPLSNWIVQASGSGGNFFANTNIDGSYSVAVNPGEYTVTVNPPSTNWNICENDVEVDISTAGQIEVVDFLAQANVDCPIMQVDISSGLLRVCLNNNNSVQYCNQGTQTAISAYVDVTIDPLLIYQSATIIPTPLGDNVYRFPVGDVEPGECGSFNFITQVDCTAPQGFTHCNQAHIYPDTSCTGTNASWSGASLEIMGDCNGEVSFTVENTGTGTMTDVLSVLVFRNTEIHHYEEFPSLAPGESQTLTFPADGATWRAEVPQENFHPQTSLIVSTVQACGTGPTSISYSSVESMTSADDMFYFDEHCRPNVAPFDPNIKSGSPTGYSSERYIPSGIGIEYQIQFQNTGTDTAFHVIVKDTLSNLYDLSTLQMGASSHPYIWELFGNGILKVTFPNIGLPTKDEDEANSIGYFDFKISVRNDLAPLTLIENQASIYFDFNEPIQTNVSFHTIEKPTINSFQSIELCAGELWNGSTYFENTFFSETFNFQLYDSISWTQIIILPNANTELSESICAGESFFFNGQTLTETGEYTAQLNTFQGCDSTVVLQLIVEEEIITELNEDICLGQTYLFNGEELNTSGEYLATLSSYQGCDSTINLNLTVIPPVEVFEEAEICEGESFEWQGQTYNMTGDYKIVLTAFNGCDSIVNLSLLVHPSYDQNISAEICEGQVYIFNGNELTAAGEYTASYQSINGCDSLVSLNLLVTDAFEIQLNENICEGESFIFNGVELTEAGEYSAELTSSAGCDSIVNLTLTVSPIENDNINAEICEGEAYIFNGEELTEAGIYSAELQTLNGCDSMVTLNLIVWQNELTELEAELCEGESIIFNGQEINETGIYEANLQTINGCDSTVFLDVTVYRTDFTTLIESICDGDTYIFNGEEITEAGEYTAELSSINGCDSIVNLFLSVDMVFEETIDLQLIIGEEYNGVPIFSDTTIIENNVAQNGCDSTVITNIFVVTSTKENIAEDLNLTVFPNPNSGQYFVQFILPKAGEIEINILDILTRESGFYSFNKVLSSGQHTIKIDGENWPSGVYLLRIKTDEGIGTMRTVLK